MVYNKLEYERSSKRPLAQIYNPCRYKPSHIKLCIEQYLNNEQEI